MADCDSDTDGSFHRFEPFEERFIRHRRRRNIDWEIEANNELLGDADSGQSDLKISDVSSVCTDDLSDFSEYIFT